MTVDMITRGMLLSVSRGAAVDVGVQLPAAVQVWCSLYYAGGALTLVCPCHQHVIDAHGDHIHTCRQHTRSTDDAHETILDALEKICYASGLSIQRHDIPSVKKSNGKTGRGNLLIKDANTAGDRHLIIDVACTCHSTHEFCGNKLRDVGRNGQLRDRDFNKPAVPHAVCGLVPQPRRRRPPTHAGGRRPLSDGPFILCALIAIC